MAHTIPPCRNETCPCYRSNRDVIVLVERPTDVSFGCRSCGGVQVRTLDWRRAQQTLYEQRTRPEYARQQKRFFIGKYAHRGG